MNLKALVIAHHAGEHAGNLIAPMREAGFSVANWYPADEAEPPVAEEEIDLLVVLGGVMGANDEAEYPWLTGEMKLVERRLAADRPTLGLCLGGQIMAKVLGARVFRAPAVELGYLPVNPTAEAPTLAPFAGNDWRVMLWHQDAFDLPAGARHLAESAMTANQAFRWGENGLALQWHPEAEAATVRTWLAKGAETVARVGYDMEDVLAQVAAWGPGMERAGAEMMRLWLAERFPAAAEAASA